MSGAGKIGKSAASAVSKVRQYKVRRRHQQSGRLRRDSRRPEIHCPTHRHLGENQQLAGSRPKALDRCTAQPAIPQSHAGRQRPPPLRRPHHRTRRRPRRESLLEARCAKILPQAICGEPGGRGRAVECGVCGAAQGRGASDRGRGYQAARGGQEGGRVGACGVLAKGQECFQERAGSQWVAAVAYVETFAGQEVHVDGCGGAGV